MNALPITTLLAATDDFSWAALFQLITFAISSITALGVGYIALRTKQVEAAQAALKVQQISLSDKQDKADVKAEERSEKLDEVAVKVDGMTKALVTAEKNTSFLEGKANERLNPEVVVQLGTLPSVANVEIQAENVSVNTIKDEEAV